MALQHVLPFNPVGGMANALADPTIMRFTNQLSTADRRAMFEAS